MTFTSANALAVAGGLAGIWVGAFGAVGWRLRPIAPARVKQAPAGLVEFGQRAILLGLVVLLGLIGVLVSPVTAIVVGSAVAGWRFRYPRRKAQQQEAELVRELPDVVDFYLVALGAGMTPVAATGVVVRRLEGRIAHGLSLILERVDLGARFADELEALPANVGEEVRPLTRVLVASERHGVPVVPALTDLAGDARMRRRRHAEIVARRLPVRLLFPLVICTLPAFLLLTVVPLAASTLRSLGS